MLVNINNNHHYNFCLRKASPFHSVLEMFMDDSVPLESLGMISTTFTSNASRLVSLHEDFDSAVDNPVAPRVTHTSL